MCKRRWWGEAPERPKTSRNGFVSVETPDVCKAYCAPSRLYRRGLAQSGQIAKTCDADNAFGCDILPAGVAIFRESVTESKPEVETPG